MLWLKRLSFLAFIILLAVPRATSWVHGLGSGTGVVNVLDYGAKCDQSTDDTIAIKNAVVAAGGVYTGTSTNAGTSILLIPRGCVISSTITVRNPDYSINNSFKIECTGSGAGLIWAGTNNTGPMFTLGDITNSRLDNGFDVENCFFTGTTSHNPSTGILLANNANNRIRQVSFTAMYNGIACQSQCLLTEIKGSFFNLPVGSGNCITMAVDNGSMITLNNFYSCGNWDYYGPNDATVTLLDNYFESNITGQLGSVYLAGDGDTLSSNTFEDGGTAGGTDFLSVLCNLCYYVSFNDNYFVGGSGSSGPSFFYKITANSGPVSWVNEKFGGNPGTYIVDAESSSISTWIGGIGDCANLFGGSQAARMSSIGACSGGFSGTYAQGNATTPAAGLSVSASGQLGSSSLTVGDTTGVANLTVDTAAIGVTVATPSSNAPGPAGGKIELVCGTNSGTAKLIAYAGTSATPVTILDNIGSGVTGC